MSKFITLIGYEYYSNLCVLRVANTSEKNQRNKALQKIICISQAVSALHA